MGGCMDEQIVGGRKRRIYNIYIIVSVSYLLTDKCGVTQPFFTLF
jgi:hypothetical protein